MKNDHVLAIVDDASPRGLECADDMDKGFDAGLGVVPVIPEMDRLGYICLVGFDQKNLESC